MAGRFRKSSRSLRAPSVGRGYRLPCGAGPWVLDRRWSGSACTVHVGYVVTVGASTDVGNRQGGWRALSERLNSVYPRDSAACPLKCGPKLVHIVCTAKGGQAMPYARRWNWVMQTTGEDTVGGAAVKLGVPRANLSRWLKSGMPIGSLMPIIVRFECDLIEALVVWGHLQDQDVAKLNYAAILKYFPGDLISREVAERYEDYLHKNPDPYQKTSVGMLRRVNGD